MKTTFRILGAIALMAALHACKQNNVTPGNLASINVTNAVIGGSALTYNTTSTTVSNNNFMQLTMIAGNSLLNLYPAATPSSSYYNNTIQTSSGDNYSLFLSGPSPSSVDAVLIKESYQNYADSLCGVRFINLSPNSNPISVNVSGSANGSIVTSLAYKAYSNFTQLPAKRLNRTYVFQIRDATTGNLITTYTMNTPYFNNVTIALRGLIASPGIILVKNY